MILLGYRGSGKTTIGRRLAEQMSMPLVDTDDLIVARAQQTIREIFEQKGESHFRDLESLAVRDACESSAIIALGGGAVLREENRDRLIASPHRRIFLRCEAQSLHQRIHADPRTAQNRPSLTHLGGGIDEIRALLAIREPLYRAVMTDELDVTDLSIDDAVEQLRKFIDGQPTG
jgi:shikimate kinase